MAGRTLAVSGGRGGWRAIPDSMDDPATDLLTAIDLLNDVADEMTAEDATEELDEATLQMFWREWPRASGWAGALWRTLNDELERRARPAGDPELDEIGGSG